MTDQNTTSGKQTKVVIPEEVRQKFPELIPQIMDSPSMDDEERNYWFNVLPIMTPDQIQELRDILKKERDKIAALEAKQNQQEEVDIEKIEAERKQRLEQRREEEQTLREQEQENAEDLLEELESA